MSELEDQYREVYFAISGKNLDPDKITRQVQIEPDHCHINGERISSKRLCQQGVWWLQGRPEDASFDVQMQSILERIRPVKETLMNIISWPEVEDANLTVACEPHPDVAIAGYCFDAAILNEFTSLGIDFAFSIHMPEHFTKQLLEEE